MPQTTTTNASAATTAQKDLSIMRRAVRSEFNDPYHGISAGPDWQAAISDYLQRGGSDSEEISELMQLFREACELENLNY